jgi:hypothetical protein
VTPPAISSSRSSERCSLRAGSTRLRRWCESLGRGAHRDEQLDPGDPTLVAQILRISAADAPPPPDGFVSPVTWGVERHVVERFGAAGIAPESISCERDTWVFDFDGTPAAFVDLFAT